MSKTAPEVAISSARHVPIHEKVGGLEDYLDVEDAAGIPQCFQIGAIEFYGWQARANRFDTTHPLSSDDADQLPRHANSKALAGWGVVSQSRPDF